MKNIYLSMSRSPFLLFMILYGLINGANPNVDQKLYKYKSAFYYGGEVIVKFRPDLKLGENTLLKTGQTSVDALLDQFQMIQLTRTFILPQRFSETEDSGLKQIYTFTYSGGDDPVKVALKLAEHPLIEYALPKLLNKMHRNSSPEQNIYSSHNSVKPNDPIYPQMTHLRLLNLEQAWDIVKGEHGNVIVAIVDGQIDWSHPDLIENVWVNPGEIEDNGIDDDGNGFVDDVHGWNFTNNTNDPGGIKSLTKSLGHGTAVAGVISARSDNELGVAGSSWNATFMPIGAASFSDTTIRYGYEGIVYAAANGADIINTSWGSTVEDPNPIEEQFLRAFVHDIIRFAVDQGALVISSAGNGSLNNDIALSLPAADPNVLSIGATRKDNMRKAAFSNYGITVDVFAPGININSTSPNEEYVDGVNGTSFSAPLVAGIAALVKTIRPDFSPEQISQQLQATARSIDNDNSGFEGNLGQGFVDANAAVTDFSKPGLQLVDTKWNDEDEDGFVENGEKVLLEVSYKNWLSTVNNVAVKLESSSTLITITNKTISIEEVKSMETAKITFELTVGEMQIEELVLFSLDVSAADYSSRSSVKLYVNPPPVATHDTGDLRVTISGKGNIGFTGFKGESYGEGFIYKGNNYLFEGGLVIAAGKSQISDCIRGVNGIIEEDFILEKGTAVSIKPGKISHELGRVNLTDEMADRPIGVRIKQLSYAHRDSAYNDFVIFHYFISNADPNPIPKLYIGLFFDWDINEDANDYARYDEDRKFGYVANDNFQPQHLAGTRLLTEIGSLNYRSINNPNEIYGGDSRDGFTDEEKWRFLTGGIQTESIDLEDVSTLSSVGPIYLESGQTIEVAFAVIGGNSEEELFANADSAQSFWDQKISAFSNHAPEFVDVLPATTILSVEKVIFTFKAVDPDGDMVRYGLLNPPENATINSVTGQFTFSPETEQIGNFTFLITASDGELTSLAEARVIVKETLFELSQNFSNPFFPGSSPTQIKYQLPFDTPVKMIIYDILGREVRRLVDKQHTPGRYVTFWDGKDDKGNSVGSGLYFYVMKTERKTVVRKLTLVR